MDEFQSIARLFRPLTLGAPEALDLMDDAAVIPSRPGFDLVITKDAIVEGVHFLVDDPPGLVARKLLRVNLSDLAAKAAEPYAYFLATAWSKAWDDARKTAFAAGLAEDQKTYGLTLLGGDTVSTPGPLTFSATMLGWVPSGGMVKRSGAGDGDVVLVSGSIGDGYLGLLAARRELAGVNPQDAVELASRYRLPHPRVELRPMLRLHATAAADVSDGLVADAGHIAEASGLGVDLDLGKMPLSTAAQTWRRQQPDQTGALMSLATGGDDYEVICSVKPSNVDVAIASARRAGLRLTAIGRMGGTPSLRVTIDGQPINVARPGWRHA